MEFISEPITPLEASFDATAMSRGEPGMPRKFRWRKHDYEVIETLGEWRTHGDCRNGSSERYVRRHVYRARTSDGTIFRIYFQRSTGRSKIGRVRWWVHSIESCAPDAVRAK